MPDPHVHTREVYAAEVLPETREVQAVLVPWDTPTEVTDDGRTRYREQFTRGGLTPADHVLLYDVHGGEAIGRLASAEDTPAGLVGTFTVADTAHGRDALARHAAGITRGVSVEFTDPDNGPGTAGGLVTRSAATLRGVALAINPQHRSPVLAVREDPPAMPTDTPIPAGDPVPTPEAAGTDALLRALDALPGQIADRLAPAADEAAYSSGPLLARAYAAEVQRLAREGTAAEAQAFHRAIPDQLTGDVPGLVNPGQFGRIAGDIAIGMPLIMAFERAPLPASGMTVEWPDVTQDPSIVSQNTQKSEITTDKMTVANKSANVQTFAGGADMSLAFIERTDPDGLVLWLRRAAEQMARHADNAAAFMLGTAIGTGLGDFPIADPTAPADVHGSLVDAAMAILGASGQWPSTMVVNSTLLGHLMRLLDADGRPIYSAAGQAVNAAGILRLAPGQRPEDSIGLAGGITVYVDPNLDTGDGTGQGLLGIPSALVSMLGPVGTLTADAVAKVGRDVGIYQFAAFLPFDASRGAATLSTAAPRRPHLPGLNEAVAVR